MIRAYAESYLDDAMENLGEAFDYAVNTCHLEIDDFMALFVTTGFSDAFGKGVPKIIVGLSGTELTMEILSKAKLMESFPDPRVAYTFSPEYWCGWVLAYYQWRTGRSFRDIANNVSMVEIRRLYGALHEASEEKFVATLNEIIRRKNNPSNLQRQRRRIGYSQKELSDRSGVNLRTLQQYESKAKDINKASAISVVALARVLGCGVEELLEYPTENIDA